jgi:hypothetical protein
MWGGLRDTPSDNWSERRYQALLPVVEHLPPERRRLWTYFKLWPNVAFDVYPDQIDFMQFLPVSPTRTVLREIAYVLPDDRREMRAARYLNWRINRQVNIEDKALIGSGSIVLHDAHVGREAVVGAGAFVGNKKVVPALAMALGVPATVKENAVTPGHFDLGVESYVHRAVRFRDHLRRLD